MYVFIYYLKFLHSQACIIITSFPSSFFFSVKQAKDTSKKDHYQLSSSSKIDQWYPWVLALFQFKEGQFFLYLLAVLKCFWSVRCSDVSEFYYNFICLPSVEPTQLGKWKSLWQLPACRLFTISISVTNRSFSHDVAAAILVYKTMNRRPYLCTKQILRELNSFHMLKLSFIPSNLQSCWTRG